MKPYRLLPGLPGLAVSCAVLLAAPALRAEPRADARPTSLSRSETLIEQGMELRQSGQEEAALPLFEEAAALDPESVRARVHLAATHQALGHWIEADALLREVLSASDDPYLERHRATLERAAEFVGRHLGSLMLSGQPAGAEVRLDGRPRGVLPLTEPLRVPVGSYQLEVVLEGYYPLRRPLVISSGGVLREAVELAPLPAGAGIASGDAAGDARGAQPASSGAGSPLWLSWTLTGLSVGAAITTGVAFAVRNHHASEYNGADCLQPGRLRGEVCGDELDAGKTAESIAYASGVATLLFTAGAIVSWTLGEPASSEAPDAVALTRCRLTLGGGMCAGSF
ncbi:MAG TPA: tetratricopeptide repeat protein [Polyangiaceae bacterium]|nr:tetratricopeptide repeat protein [Polyangiaceae bacterium]